eukprot:6192454-Pleurochrysis_carterae.AAC.1
MSDRRHHHRRTHARTDLQLAHTCAYIRSPAHTPTRSFDPSAGKRTALVQSAACVRDNLARPRRRFARTDETRAIVRLVLRRRDLVVHAYGGVRRRARRRRADERQRGSQRQAEPSGPPAALLALLLYDSRRREQ